MNRSKTLLDSDSSLRWLALIVVVAAVIRLMGYAGFVGGDDWHYLTSAVELASGDVTYDGGHWQCRTGVTVPAAILHRLGAPSWMVLGGTTFFWSLLCIPIAFWSGLEFTQDRRVAMLAAAFVAIFPLDIIYATCLYPILGIAATTALAGTFFVRAIRTKSWSDFALLGLCLGLAYLHRVTSLYVGIPMLIWAIWKKEWHRGYFLAAAVAFCCLGGEMLFFQVTGGDPLVRIDVLTSRTATVSNAPLTAIRPGGRLFSPILSLLTNQELGLFYLAAPFALFAIIRRTPNENSSRDAGTEDSLQVKNAMTFLMLWFVVVLAYTMWGSTSPFSYKPLRPWPRYYSQLTIPLLLLLSYWIIHFLQPRMRIAVCFVLVSVAFAGLAIDNSRTFQTLGPQLLKLRGESTSERFLAVRSAYLFMYTANDCRPPLNVELISHHPNGIDPRADQVRKLDPEMPFAGAWEELSSGIIVIPFGASDKVPGNWQKIAEIRRSKSMIYDYGARLGGVFEYVFNRSQSKKDLAVFRVD
ncbi:MAG: glycosyltransferase family 39 protein [Planctomycetota bacterium]|nr:glycosyltransferase family 39 protein [Planctomycetota bacterium]